MVSMMSMVICTMIVSAPVWPPAMMSALKYHAGSKSGTSSSSAPSAIGTPSAGLYRGTVAAGKLEGKYMISKGFNSRHEKRPKVLILGGKRRILWFNSLDRKTEDVLNPWNFRSLTTTSVANG